MQPDFYAHAYVDRTRQDIAPKELLISEPAEILVKKEIKEKRNQIAKAAQDSALVASRQVGEGMEAELYRMVGDAPIKEMVPYIARKDRKVAAFIVGIAKKESNWGSASPQKDGQDCYNYWGYKGEGARGSAMGYSCFASAQEGVEVVSKRIADLVSKDRNTPSRMVVWKCGSSCSGHDPAAVQKWISDVDIYFSRIVLLEG
ncbi:MAG TPA: hypothetical protein PKA31_01035 [Candidatus Moranbacteria bacterium]|nr:hypothetical protein [Candidatus Moranbacteria bacterium]